MTPDQAKLKARELIELKKKLPMLWISTEDICENELILIEIGLSASGILQVMLDELDRTHKLPVITEAQEKCQHEKYEAMKPPRPRHCLECGLQIWDAGD